MKSFVFSLESLLKLRAQQTEKALQNWADAIQELKKATALSRHAMEDLRSWFESQREQHTSGNVQAGELIQSHRMASELQKIWFLQERRRQNVEIRVKNALKMWEIARRNEEIIERLKERAHQQWALNRERLEQKMVDELATLKSFRQKGTFAFSRI